MFYPDISAELEFGTLRFAEKEVFTDFPEGAMRTADVVAELQTSDSVEKLVLVHIEVQFEWGSDFGERVYEYYTLLRGRYRKPIIPIAVFLHGGGDGVVEGFKVAKCDLKGTWSTSEILPSSLHGTQLSDAFQCPSERAGGPGEYRDHAGLRATEAVDWRQ